MSSSDDTDSVESSSDDTYSVESSSDDTDSVESSHRESGGGGNDDQLPGVNDRNRVSETVFLEGTESATNGGYNSVQATERRGKADDTVMFFAASSIAAPIARPVNTNRTANRPTIHNAGNSAAGRTSIARPIDTNRTTDRPVIANTYSSAAGSTSIVRTIDTKKPTAQNPHCMGKLGLVSGDITPKAHANISPTQPNASLKLSSISRVNKATSQGNQRLGEVRALEARIARDTCRDDLSSQQLVNASTNSSILGCFSEFLQRVFSDSQTYTPLPTPSYIRVLAVQPGVNDDTLVASFELLDLNLPNFRFEAISYQWSEGGGQKAPIRLGGKRISINAYLRSILLHLRLKRRVRILWADALCINQADHVERLQQVSIMQRIYSRAFRVFGFVGKDYLHAGKCFNAIKTLTSAWFDAQKRFGEEDSTSSAHDNIYGCVIDEAAMSRIVEIFQSGYWKRLWVVQELVSSRRAIIRWGDAEISWTLLGLATTLIRNNKRLMTMFSRIEKSKKSPGTFHGSQDARTGLMNAYLMYRMPSVEFRTESMSFLDVLRLTRNFDVSEQLDRIYAILGLPSQHTGPKRKSIPPDYRLLPEGLYSRVFYWVFQSHENPLEILSAVRHTTLFYPDYPTWIPQWHVKPIRSIGGSHRAGMKFDASAGWKPKPPVKLVWKRNERHLILQGFVLGSVTSSHRVFPRTNTKDPRVRCEKLIAHNAKFDGWLDQNVNSHNSIKMQLSLVLTAGQDWYGNIIKEQTAIDRLTESFERWKPKYFQNRALYDEAAIRYGQAVGNVCDERQIFTATNGLLGLGPNLLRKDDVVCVVAGGPVPYILRPLSDDSFYFVGECYVAGYMFGEAVVDWRSQAQASLSLRQFILNLGDSLSLLRRYWKMGIGPHTTNPKSQSSKKILQMTDQPVQRWSHKIPTNLIKDWDKFHLALKDIYGYGPDPTITNWDATADAVNTIIIVRKEEPKNLLEELQKNEAVAKE
ncbi:hypothetical protein F53441_5694 [Fusarium austroafricanum]|uniref:Heterokaryon incompatibility domain-containing protein n=1 Tax=Fusarium austroafricanum TaxID=2364996 RepID=A0A8H4KL91_9HYPO|nr:hypothetical protein F53441_5694 [Fusarium austroafricanum]